MYNSSNQFNSLDRMIQDHGGIIKFLRLKLREHDKDYDSGLIWIFETLKNNSDNKLKFYLIRQIISGSDQFTSEEWLLLKGQGKFFISYFMRDLAIDRELTILEAQNYISFLERLDWEGITELGLKGFKPFFADLELQKHDNERAQEFQYASRYLFIHIYSAYSARVSDEQLAAEINLEPYLLLGLHSALSKYAPELLDFTPFIRILNVQSLLRPCSKGVPFFIYLCRLGLDDGKPDHTLLEQLFKRVNAFPDAEKSTICMNSPAEESIVWQAFFIATFFNSHSLNREYFNIHKELNAFLLYCVDHCEWSQFLRSFPAKYPNTPLININSVQIILKTTTQFPIVFERFLERYNHLLDCSNIFYELFSINEEAIHSSEGASSHVLAYHKISNIKLNTYKLDQNKIFLFNLENHRLDLRKKEGVNTPRIHRLERLLQQARSLNGYILSRFSHIKAPILATQKESICLDDSMQTVPAIDEREVDAYALSLVTDPLVEEESALLGLLFTDDEPVTDMGCTSEHLDENTVQKPRTPLVAGVQDKYLGGNLPIEPTSSTSVAADTIQYDQKQVYVCFSSRLSAQIVNAPLTINYHGLDAELYSAQRNVQENNHKVTFVCAGRKENALLPEVGADERVIVVLSKEELTTLDRIPVEYDLLVINSLHSQHFGSYDNPGAITSRRLAIFLFASYWNLPCFIMLDDNIREVNNNLSVNGSEGPITYQSVYDLLLKELEDKACVAVPTFSYRMRERKEGELNSKFFMINLYDIRAKLNYDDALLYLLFPEAVNLGCWGEDYYFQIMLDGLFAGGRQAIGVVSADLVCLVRSKHHINSFRKTNKLAELLPPLSEEACQNLTAEQKEWVSHGIGEFNRIVENNKQRYLMQKSAIESLNIMNVHASANGIKPIEAAQPFSVPQEDIPFPQRWQSMGNAVSFTIDKLRYYQQEAIKQAVNMPGQTASLIMTTGSGKSRVQFELARLAYHAALDGEMVFIVTPYIKLVDQFYGSFIEYNQHSSSDENDLRVPSQNIVKISSDSRSCNLSLITMNSKWKRGKTIFIFCQDSFDKLLSEHPDLMTYCSLLLLDEYSEYPKTLAAISEHGVQNGDNPLIIGSTATPRPKNPLPPIYTYTRAQGVRDGILAPVIAAELGLDYSRDNLKLLTFNLVQLLKQVVLPGYAERLTLSQARGIIYLPSINDCDVLEKILNAGGLKCYSIHSKNPMHRLQLDSYLSTREPTVLLAVNMLGIGFDDPSLSWVMFAFEQQKINWMHIEQMIGRVMRKDGNKIGLVMGFNQIIRQSVMPLLQEQPMDLSLINPAYFNQRLMFGVENSSNAQAFEFKTRLNETSAESDFNRSVPTNPQKRSLGDIYESQSVMEEGSSKRTKHNLGFFEKKTTSDKSAFTGFNEAGCSTWFGS